MLFRSPAPYVARLWAAALAGAAVGWGVRLVVPAWHPIVVAVLVLGPFGLVYFAVATAFRLPEAQTFVRKIARRAR